MASGVLLAIAITAVYIYAIIGALTTAGEPPLLADQVPTQVVPNPASDSQLRGAVDKHKNMLNVIAIISPLVTTVVGFYFGHRAGAAGKEAEKSRAALETTHTIRDVTDMPEEQKSQLIGDLRRKGLL